MNSPQAEPVLIAALSGRALAQAARRDGYAPLVADLFGDLDTQQVAETRRVSGDLRCGLDARSLERALDELAAPRTPLGFVYGSGFEQRLGLLRRLGSKYRLLGNSPAVVRRVKKPESLARLCADLGIPHPKISFDQPASGDWLVKRTGASGGSHVRPLSSTIPRGHYAQRRIPGTPVSALFAAGPGGCTILGWSTQWADPAAEAPFRFGGAVRPALPALPMAEAVRRLAAEAGLVGLNSADFLIESNDFNLIEINPRLGASLDLFASLPLFRMHVAACNGEPVHASKIDAAAAMRVVYAPAPLRIPPALSWPDWTADRSAPHIAFQPGAPVCTVLAEAGDAEAARRLVDERAAHILSLLETDA